MFKSISLKPNAYYDTGYRFVYHEYERIDYNSFSLSRTSKKMYKFFTIDSFNHDEFTIDWDES